MPHLTRQEAFEHFKEHATNSSHFVWLLCGIQFYETRNSWVFGYLKTGSVTLLALEPLIPKHSYPEGSFPENAFIEAWKEFDETVEPKIAAFVAVYSPFTALLSRHGFKSVRIGHEPWMNLKNCIPRGNSGKGVRSARNQALRQGLYVQELCPVDLEPGSTERAQVEALYRDWQKLHLIELGGFMNASDPFLYKEYRRYFAVKNKDGKLEGYLIATPIAGIHSYFLEDLVLSSQASKGAGELLTLEAMIALGESGIKSASLGVVSVLGAQGESTAGSNALPPMIRWLLIGAPHFARRFYNFDGLQTFRKRFMPEQWKDIHLCVRSSEKTSETWAWILVLFAILRAFQPRLQISAHSLIRAAVRPFRRYPVTWSVGLISAALFSWINHLGELPAWALDTLGFSPKAPFSEWLYRSIISDFIYFDRIHYLFCALPLLALIAWAEKTHSRRFVVSFIALIAVLDDFLNFAVIMKPFHYTRPHIFGHLIASNDVGGSLWLASLVGLQLCKLRKNREILFASICLVSVFGFVFAAEHFHALILNLNHFLFLVVGYISGKIIFELERRKSRLVAKGKAPQAKCVLPAEI